MATLSTQFLFENNYNDSIGSNNMAAAGSGNAFATDQVKQGTYSLQLNGSGQARITSSVSGLPTGNSDLSVTFWVQRTGYQSLGMMVDLGTAANNQNYQVGSTSSTNIRVSEFADDINITVSAMSLGVWYFICATYVASTKLTTVYLNGSSVGSGNHTNNLNLTYGHVAVGNDGSDGYGSSTAGYFDDVRIYTGTLSASDVTALYNSYTPATIVPSGMTTNTKFFGS